MSIVDDMRAAALQAAETRRNHEWRIGTNAWPAFLADLHHRDLWNSRRDSLSPPSFLGFKVVRVIDLKQPMGWELVPVKGRLHPVCAETEGDCA